MHGKSPRFAATILVLPSLILPMLLPGVPSEAAPALPGAAIEPEQAASPDAASPLMFVENAGQFPAAVRFQARAGDRTVWLADDALWIQVQGAGGRDQPALGSPGGLGIRDQGRENRDWGAGSREWGSGNRGQGTDDAGAEPPSPDPGPRTPDPGPRAVNLKLTFEGANPKPSIEAAGRLATHVSYFLGSDPSAWRSDVPVWGAVRYRYLYPGIDLDVDGAAGMWAWRLVAGAGADLSAVRLRVEGAQALSIEGGHLRVTTAGGDVTLPLLQVDGGVEPGAALPQPSLSGSVITAPFVRESLPTLQAATDLVYGTYLGGDGQDWARSIAVDSSGSAYVAGFTDSAAFTTTAGVIQPALNGALNAFVVKLNPAGTGLIYSTFLGGSSSDYAVSIAIDGDGNAYLAGEALSRDFPTTAGAFKRAHSDATHDAFVSKLNADGTALVYSTFLGGTLSGSYGYDGIAVAIDAGRSAYVTGGTGSADFPTTAGALDTAFNASGKSDAFVSKLNADGTALVYSTFLGAGKNEAGRAIAVDGKGRACVAGITESAGFPTTAAAFDRTFNGGTDVFVTRLSPAGNALSYSTFLGGTAQDIANGIAVDGLDQAFVTGETSSSAFPTTVGAFDRTRNAVGVFDSDAFVTKLNQTGSGLVYSTYLGGSMDQRAFAIAVDGAGNANVTGGTLSTNFPTTPDALKRACGADGACDSDGYRTYSDVFVTRLNKAGSNLLYSTYVGGHGNDTGLAIALSGQNTVFVAGVTYSSDFPTSQPAFNRTYGGWEDAFVTRLLAAYVRRVNAGGPLFRDRAGFTWSADKPYAANGWGYVNGITNTTTAAIGTLYRTDRSWAPSGIPGYRFTVPNGVYTVTMKFAETVYNGPGIRKFDVRIEGAPVLSSYDIFADAGAMNRPVADKVFTTTVSDGELTIDFIKLPGFRTPKVNAIAVQQASEE